MKNHIAISIILFCTNVFALGTLTVQFDPTAGNALSAAIRKVADEAQQLNTQGLDALERNDLSAALELFTKALNVFPQYSDAFNNRGVVFYRRGDVAGAQRAWEEAIRHDPQYHVGYYNLGLILVQGKKPNEAIKQFETAIKHNKNFTEAIVRIGVIHLEANRPATALEHFAKAYKGAPAHQDAWNFYSYGLLVTGDTAGAVTVLKNAGENAAALAQLGRIEIARGQHAKAAEYLARAVERGAPPTVALDLAAARLDAGKCKEALATANSHIASQTSPSIDAWLIAGAAAKECEGDQKALDYYERGLKTHPGDPLLAYNAGQIHFALRNYAKAEEMWNRAGDAYQNPQILYMRAVAARFRNDLANAELHIKKAIAMDEKAEYHDFLGVIRHAKGDSKAAEEHFRKALKIDPNLASAQLNLAVKSKDAADLDKAIADADKRFASCKASDCADAGLQLSILYYHQRKYDKALSTLESVKDASKTAGTYRHIAIYSKELQRHDKAVAALETAAAKFGGDTKLQYELAEAYLAAGDPSKSIKIFLALLPKWKDNVWRLHYQIGYAYMEMNDLTNAKKSFENSLAAKKDSPAARALLAFVLNRMGDTEKAVDQWEKTAGEDGSNAAIHINLGLSYEGKGQFDRALESYKKAQSIDPNDKAININLGNVYKGLGRIPEAFDAYTKGLESGKRDLAAYNIFLLSRQKNDNDRAGKMYELLKKEFPSSVHCQRVSGEMDLIKGDTAKALASYEKIKDKDTDDWYALARIYAARGQKANAENALAKIPNEGQWTREKNLIRARLAFNTGDYKAAYQAYRDAVKTSQSAGDDVHIYNMVLAAHNAGLHKEAMDAAAGAVKKVQGPARAEICRIAGNSAVAIKDWKEAKNWFGQLTAIEPNNAVTQYNLAVAHYNLNEVEDAYKRYQKARDIDKKIQNKDIELRYEQFKRGGPTSASSSTTSASQAENAELDAMYNEAVDLQTAKKVDQAEKLYNKILNIDPDHSQAWNNLGAIYGARGDLELAEAAYTNALKRQAAPETFANLANIYIALEDYAKAKDAVARGLAANPGNRMLGAMEQKVKAKLK